MATATIADSHDRTPGRSETLVLQPEALYALSNQYAVDGRVSWHDPAVRGYAPMNCYLVQEPSGFLLLDTGLTVHQDALVAQLEAAGVTPGRLELLLLRQGEFDSVCNLVPLAERFEVETVHGQFEDTLGWADFHPELAARGVGTDRSSLHVRTELIHSRFTLPFGDGGRTLVGRRPTLRLLNTHWVYDDATRTLFTSDSFTHVVRATAGEDFVVTADSDTTSVETVVEHLRQTRYWWLQGARVEEVRADVAAFARRHRIETVAPAYGCLLRGEDVVARHFELLDGALAQLGERAARQGAWT